MKLIKQIENFKPYNQQETQDKAFILEALKEYDTIFFRKNKNLHMTASGWVTNPDHKKVLMIHHNIYNSWSWMGGHADGEKDLYEVALKEIHEESGVSNIKPITSDIFSLEVLTVDGHIKNGVYVSSHLHLNITYLFEADECDELQVRPEENSDVRWFELNEAIQASTEPWFKENIYKKLNEKLNLINKNH